MAGSVSVSVRSLVLAGLVLLALVTAYLLGGAGGSPPAQAQTRPGPADQAAEPSGARTLRVTGSGETTVVPDQLAFTLSVTARQPDLDDALARASGTARRVLAALRGLGVRGADVQTTGLQMYPEYDYPSSGPPVLSGYRVTQRSRVTIRELADGGEAVSTAVGAGGNGVRVTDIRLGVSDPGAALGRARDAAVEEATEKAEQYAAATGRTLGEVVTLRETGRGRPPAPVRRSAFQVSGAADALTTLPIRAGTDDVRVRVLVVWSLG